MVTPCTWCPPIGPEWGAAHQWTEIPCTWCSPIGPHWRAAHQWAEIPCTWPPPIGPHWRAAHLWTVKFRVPDAHLSDQTEEQQRANGERGESVDSRQHGGHDRMFLLYWLVCAKERGHNETTEMTTNYISFCVGNVIPQKAVKMYPNNKPSV